MGLRRGWRAKIWAVDVKDNYTIAEMSTSTKNKDGVYEKDWYNKHVLLVGDAHDAKVNVGDLVTIGDFEVRNRYDKEKNTTYTDYKVFSFDNVRVGDRESGKTERKTETNQKDDEELPFD